MYSLLRSRSGRSHATLPVPKRLLQTDIHSFLGINQSQCGFHFLAEVRARNVHQLPASFYPLSDRVL